MPTGTAKTFGLTGEFDGSQDSQKDTQSHKKKSKRKESLENPFASRESSLDYYDATRADAFPKFDDYGQRGKRNMYSPDTLDPFGLKDDVTGVNDFTSKRKYKRNLL